MQASGRKKETRNDIPKSVDTFVFLVLLWELLSPRHILVISHENPIELQISLTAAGGGGFDGHCCKVTSLEKLCLSLQLGKYNLQL